MKRMLALFLAILLVLPLCACGKKQAEEAPVADGAPISVPEPETDSTPTPAPVNLGPRDYQRVEINAENWSRYFTLREIPLYSITSSQVIAQVYQTYCVVLRDEYLSAIKPDGDYSVRFSFEFDLSINTLNVDTKNFIYSHTDDLLYAVRATKSAIFDKNALPYNAYGTDHSLYSGYSNAFFTGWATIHPESKVWSGFYIDLDRVALVSVEGYLELAL